MDVRNVRKEGPQRYSVRKKELRAVYLYQMDIIEQATTQNL